MGNRPAIKVIDIATDRLRALHALHFEFAYSEAVSRIRIVELGIASKDGKIQKSLNASEGFGVLKNILEECEKRIAQICKRNTFAFWAFTTRRWSLRGTDFGTGRHSYDLARAIQWLAI